MQLLENDEVLLTVDDEEAICTHCDNFGYSGEVCEIYCGSQHSWGGYQRKVSVEEYYEKDEF